MLLFCLAVEPIMGKLKEKGIKFVAYADDIVLCVDQSVDTKTIVNEMKTEYKRIGLTINDDKCSSTDNGGEIEFMGQQFQQEEAISISKKLFNKIDHTLAVIEQAPITEHEKFLFISLVAVSQVNYGPLVEQSTEYDDAQEAYYQID